MVLETLAKLSAAEQFFEALAVPFDPQVLDVNRLHILKRFKDLMRAAAMDGLDEAATEVACRVALARAYRDFAEGRGAKTFKVFQDARPGFVPLEAIRR